MLILEGPDFAGKTTLAKKLVEQTDGDSSTTEIVHFGPPDAGPNGAWLQYTTELVYQQKLLQLSLFRSVVYDRFMHGEQIYPQALGRPSDFTVAHARMLERVLLGLNARLVVCLPPWPVVRKGWLDRLDDELIKDEDSLYLVYKYYERLVAVSNLPLKTYDFTRGPSQYTAVLNMLKGRFFPNLGPGIGAFRPGNILLVGEQVNENTGTTGWPFVASSGCSLWLAQLLEHEGIHEKGLYWINAMDKAGNYTDPNFIEALKPSLTVAMGKTAEGWVEWYVQSPRCAVPHPQFWKRFHGSERYPLLDILKTHSL